MSLTDIDQPVPVAREKTTENEEVRVRPWVRFWARIFDYQLFILIFGLFVFYTAGPELAVSFSMPIVAIFLWTFVETFLLATCGYTPGKWLLKVTVRNEDGSKLSFRKALQRSFSVWWLGYGAGIPVINVITMIVACVKLSNLKTTTWDKHGHFRVTHDKIGFFRIAIVVLFFAFLIALMVGAQIHETHTFEQYNPPSDPSAL